MQSNQLGYRPHIDGLRAIAVLSVVIYHAFPTFLQGGFVGVDIFFVISGFLISSIIFEGIQKNNFSYLNFYIRRIKRLFPALVFVLSACLVFGWLILLPEDFTLLGKNIVGGAGFFANFTLWRDSGYFNVSREFNPLAHLWSLGIEEQFYLIWPLLIGVCFKKHLQLVIILALISSFLLNYFFIDIKPSATFYFPVTRLWELALGSLLAWSIHKKNKANLLVLFASRYKLITLYAGILTYFPHKPLCGVNTP